MENITEKQYKALKRYNNDCPKSGQIAVCKEENSIVVSCCNCGDCFHISISKLLAFLDK